VEPLRKPFQGVTNIVRFNWHFYALSLAMVAVSMVANEITSHTFHYFLIFLNYLVIATTLLSLVVSSYIYDFSDLYTFTWLEDSQSEMKQRRLLNIHSGFDETSALIKNRFSNDELVVFDFYDKAKHTEVSIRRARRMYPPFPGTRLIETHHVPVEDYSADLVFLILTAHEIREQKERIVFFNELYRTLKPEGRIIVVEHIRDTANFLAYTVGFFHFHSRTCWLTTFREAGLFLHKETKITPFITLFTLRKDGSTS